MKLETRIIGQLEALMEGEILRAERAVTRGINAAGLGLKKDWRSQVISAGLGRRLANTVRSNTYPKQGESISAASLVYSRADVVVDAHDRGALISSPTGFWLAVPIGPAVQKMRGAGNKRITPNGWEQKTGRQLEFIPRKGRPPLLVDTGIPMRRQLSDPISFEGSRYRKWKKRGSKRGRVWTPIFVLVPQVKLPKRMDFDRDTRRWEARLPRLIVNRWPEGRR